MAGTHIQGHRLQPRCQQWQNVGGRKLQHDLGAHETIAVYRNVIDGGAFIVRADENDVTAPNGKGCSWISALSSDPIRLSWQLVEGVAAHQSFAHREETRPV